MKQEHMPSKTPSLNEKTAEEIEIALGPDLGVPHIQLKRRRHGVEGDPGAGHQGLQQHVAGTGVQPRAAHRRVQARLDQGAARVHRAGDTLADRAFGLEGR